MSARTKMAIFFIWRRMKKAAGGSLKAPCIIGLFVCEVEKIRPYPGVFQ